MTDPERPAEDVPGEEEAAAVPEPPAGEPAAGSPAGAPGAAEPEAPALARAPGWVPATVVAGAVLLVEGLIVKQIGGEGGDEGSERVVADIAAVSMVLGGLALGTGYFAFLAAQVALASAFEAFVLSAVTAVSYLLGWHALLAAVSGHAADLWFVEAAGLEGKGAAVGAVAGILAFTAGFALALRHAARIVWPHFRSGVALNVMAMLHLVVLLFGTVSALNRTLTPRFLGTGIDLTDTGRFSLNEKTLGILGKVEGELKAFLLDYPQEQPSAWTERTRDLLHAFAAQTPRVDVRVFEPFRDADRLREALQAAGMEQVLGSLTGEEDVVVLGYRPPGEKLFARTKVVPVDVEFSDVTALGNRKFKGEGILANAVNEIVFVQRKVYFTEGHGELAVRGAGSPMKSLSSLAEALRNDNFAVTTHDTVRNPTIPADADLVVAAAPSTPFSGAEVEGLREFLDRGGALVVLLDVRAGAEGNSGLGGLLSSWGIRPREDALIISYSINRGPFGANVSADMNFQAGREEFGRHPAMEALRRTTFTLAFFDAMPVLLTEEPPKGIEVEELVYAPREVAGQKPYGAVLRKGRTSLFQPEQGDILNRRLPVIVAAEKPVGAGEGGGGRVVVSGDASFLTDDTLPRIPPNRTLFLNVASWAVRRDLIVIDPKTIETEIVSLRPVDRELSFWTAVVALPVITLGIALGVWWSRRR